MLLPRGLALFVLAVFAAVASVVVMTSAIPLHGLVALHDRIPRRVLCGIGGVIGVWFLLQLH